MPSWSIHLKVGHEVNKKLKLNNNLFMYGNFLPDVDKGMPYSRRTAHYYGLKCEGCDCEDLPDANAFYKEHKDKFNNPLIVGYYIHILTDYYFNNYAYQNKWITKNNKIIGIKLKSGKDKIYKQTREKNNLKYKQADFELYGKKLYNEVKQYLPRYDEQIIKYAKDLKFDMVNQQSLQHRFNFLNNEFEKANKITLKEKLFGYKIFTQEELDALMNKCIKFVMQEIENKLKRG